MGQFIHGDNIHSKLCKSKSGINKKLILEISKRYNDWKQANLSIIGTNKSDISRKVDLFNEYKKFIDQEKFKKQGENKNGFTSQSKLHSTVLEEFMYYLFKDIEKIKNNNDNPVTLGNNNAYTNLYFSPANFDSLKNSVGIEIHTKNQDFAICKQIIITSKPINSPTINTSEIFIPIVSIECKTYLDKTMFEGSVSTAEKIKKGNPYSLFIIVTETYEVDREVDPAYSLIDQIYILRKDNNENNPINFNIVYDLFCCVKNHLNSDWKNIDIKIKKGKLI
ncbi:MAG: Bpu10I family restriction endonuclease [Bacteroidales bacterium]|nr:Bpu10I family restriction endonuclease [Bacteroidales bacterium]